MKKLLLIIGLISQTLLFGHAPVAEKPCQITPPYSPLSSKVDFTIDVEFLYWYANITDLDYAIKREIIDVPDPIVDTTRTVARGKERFDNKWGPGVRVGFGVIGSEDGWDLYANGFYFDVSTSESHDVAPVTDSLDLNNPGLEFYTSPWFFLAPNSGSFGNPFNQIYYSHLSASWHLEHYQIDLELGRKFWISQRLTLRPFIGLRGYHSEQRLKLHASAPIGQLILPHQDEKLKARQKNWGVGLLTGINTNWHITPRWSVYGNASVALTYGRLDVKEKDRIFQEAIFQQGVPEVAQNFETTLRDAYYKLMPLVDLGAGVQFENIFKDNAYRLILSAGWESHFLFDYNEFLRGTNPFAQTTDLPSANGNLTLSGFVLRARFDF